MTRPLRAARAAASAGLTIAVTGAATPLGQMVCRHLTTAEGVRAVLALDTRKPRVPKARWRRTDRTDPALASALYRVDALVYLAGAADPDIEPAEWRRRMVTGASVAVTAAAATGVRHVVLLSSARVYGAHPDNPIPLPDDAPLRAHPDGSALDVLLDIEEYAERARRIYPQVAITTLRPAPLIGPGVDDPAGGFLDSHRLLTLRGSRTSWQFCHVDDLVTAVLTVLRSRLAGAVTLGSGDWITPAEVDRIVGRRRIELPAGGSGRSVAPATAARLRALGVTGDPAGQLSYLRYPWVVSSARLRAEGWEPVYSSAEALASWVHGRSFLPMRVTARGATAAAGAAAGATVALVGAAALVRRARRRRSRR